MLEFISVDSDICRSCGQGATSIIHVAKAVDQPDFKLSWCISEMMQCVWSTTICVSEVKKKICQHDIHCWILSFQASGCSGDAWPVDGDIAPVLARIYPPVSKQMRCRQIYDYGLHANGVAVATDVGCHCGEKKKKGRRERPEKIGNCYLRYSWSDSLHLYILVRLNPAELLLFSSQLQNRTCNTNKHVSFQGNILFLWGSSLTFR